MRSKDEVQEQMFNHIEQWQQSGLTQKAFCQQTDLPYHIFHYWYKRYRHQESPPGSSFIKLDISQGVSYSLPQAELILPDGKRFLFHQPLSIDYLKALIG
jgi:hypothetical protein